ncbi:cilia- and flagella-associated protein 20-like [Phlebotomus papatasi]|uniref:cilia- and flagella-associated protein 20-like n=1 Tax=Phlebotomus papatasi TaxID=29031 RepID=UPI00248385DE|nr:cilia- and flagella-associated protein 20-like [Phlebotomus papatasi]
MSESCLKKDFITVFYSGGSKPLENWSVSKLQTGHGKIRTDEEIRGFVLELISTNVATAFIQTPLTPLDSLKIKWPFVTLQLKNLKRYFAFEIQVLDDQGIKRRLRFANYQKKPKVGIFCTQMPLYLNPGWNQIQLNLPEYMRRAYGTNYVETVGMVVHANTRLRRIYFTRKLYPEEEKPSCFRVRIFPPKHKDTLSKNHSDNKTKEHPSSPRSDKS